MNREEFNLLAIDEQVKVFNDILKKGSIRKSCKELKIGKTTIRNRFKKSGYVFNNKENQYIKDYRIIREQEEIKSNINITEKREKIKSDSKITQEIKNNIRLTQKEIESNLNITQREKEIKSNVILTKEMHDKLMEVIRMSSDLKAMVSIWKESAITNTKMLNIKNFDGDLYVKSIKVYGEVLDEFNKFVEGHRELKQQEIINQALWEFLQKYN